MAERLATVEGLRVERFEDGIVVFDPRSELVALLDSNACLVWDALLGRPRMPDLVRLVAATVGCDPSEIRTDVYEVIARLRREGLIESNGRGEGS